MNISTQTQAVLLLTAWLSPADRSAKPLSPGEWGRFAHWLKERGAAPDALLAESDPQRALAGWSDRSVTVARIAQLLGRSAALGLALEKWERAGLWVMTRSDADYPQRLKKRLKLDAPPVLFGCGNRQLLNRGGVAVVGSRDASEMDLAFTTDFGRRLASQGVAVVSGGARGVDETAMLGALSAQGTVVGVLADSLLRAATAAKFRAGLVDGSVALLSPFNPEAGFDVGNAMARNKYIYCLGDAAVVVAASRGTGGTWNGALENLRAGWVPLWVKRSEESQSGVAALVSSGARWLPGSEIEVADLIAASANVPESRDLFASTSPVIATVKDADDKSAHTAPAATALSSEPDRVAEEPAEYADHRSLYDFFIYAVGRETRREALPIDILCERLDLQKGQVGHWLKRAVEEGKLKKLQHPVRYQIVTGT